MKRDLEAVERDISEAEASSSSLDDKFRNLQIASSEKLKELETRSIECNQALRSLNPGIKLGGEFQYVLNANGSTPAEVLGINYKSTLKPAISAYADETKKSPTTSLEEFIALQPQIKELSTRIEAKKQRLAVLQLQNDGRKRECEVMKNSAEEYVSQCENEVQRIKKAIEAKEAEDQKLEIMKQEATDTLKVAELKLQEETLKIETKTQLLANELLSLLDSATSFKEHNEKKISDLENDFFEIAECLTSAYKNTLLPGFDVDV